MVHTTAAVLTSTGHVLSWGWFSIELANLVMILVMVVVFALALLVPFGSSHRRQADRERRDRP